MSEAKPHAGTDVFEFFAAMGNLTAIEQLAAKKVLVVQLEELLAAQKVSRAELARRMETTRVVVRRLLDPENTSVTLATIASAAVALGAQLSLKLSPRPRAGATTTASAEDRKKLQTHVVGKRKAAKQNKPAKRRRAA